ncbi:MAG: phosphoglycerate dehydrogenase, partial [Bdellovibrionaceae bacterium]|nr:phosphoglycerate dehydrogenase [Pseudobdellovibrionaceae bacterium]
MHKTLVVNRFNHESILRLQNSKLTEVFSSSNIGTLKEHFESTAALLLRSGTKIDKNTLPQFPNLKVIISATSGFDHIDFKLCKKQNIQVMHTPNANAISAAEHTIGLIIASMRNYGTARDNIKMGNWDREPLMGFELYGKTLGVIGFGRIGSRVAQIASAFGMKIIAHDPYVNQEPHPHVEFLGLEEV